MKTSTFVIAALTSNASSLNVERPYSNELLEYRPYTNGDTPWYKTSPKKAADPDYPINYAVPDYGVDQDIMATQGSQASSENILGVKLHATFEKPKSHPMNYFIPDFGADADIVNTGKNLEDSEKLAGKKFVAATQSSIPTYPINYKVVDYGRDKDILATELHAKLAEKQIGHVWANLKKKEDDKILRNYEVPDFGVDQDIITTTANLKKAEDTLGPWKVLTQQKETAWDELAQSGEDLRLEQPVSIAEMMRRTNQVYHPYGGYVQTGLRDDLICPSGTGCPVNPLEAAEQAAVIQYRTNVPLETEIGDTIVNEKYAANYHGENSAYVATKFGKYVPWNN